MVIVQQRSLHVNAEKYSLARAFTISRGVRHCAEVVIVEIQQGDCIGRGECVPYARYQETVSSVIAAIEAVTQYIAVGCSRDEINTYMPAGAARNAVDCALWDLDAKIKQQSVWRSLALTVPEVIVTADTISLASLDAMLQATRAALKQGVKLLKIKLDDQQVVAKIAAIRDCAPEVDIIIDANEAWTYETLIQYSTALLDFNISMIEQPLPAGDDAQLKEISHPIALCADESCHTCDDLPKLKGCYEIVNIKLDKTGGLTEALALAERAKQQGFRIMVGCMLSTSLSIAPALALTPYAEFIDLDGPRWLAQDREGGMVYDQGVVKLADPNFWGA